MEVRDAINAVAIEIMVVASMVWCFEVLPAPRREYLLKDGMLILIAASALGIIGWIIALGLVLGLPFKN